MVSWYTLLGLDSTFHRLTMTSQFKNGSQRLESYKPWHCALSPQTIVAAMGTLVPPVQLACPGNQFRIQYILNIACQKDFEFPPVSVRRARWRWRVLAPEFPGTEFWDHAWTAHYLKISPGSLEEDGLWLVSAVILSTGMFDRDVWLVKGVMLNWRLLRWEVLPCKASTSYSCSARWVEGGVIEASGAAGAVMVDLLGERCPLWGEVGGCSRSGFCELKPGLNLRFCHDCPLCWTLAFLFLCPNDIYRWIMEYICINEDE